MRFAIILILAALFSTTGPRAAVAAPLAFAITEGNSDNYFYADGPVAAHLMLTSGTAPRIVVAFPAGNSGAILYLAADGQPLKLTTLGDVRPVSEAGLHGIEADISLDRASVTITDADVGSVRFLRRAVDAETMAARPDAERSQQDTGMTWTRDGRYQMTLSGSDVDILATSEGMQLSGRHGAPVRLVLRVLTGDQPLTPLAGAALLNDSAAVDEHLKNVLGFLAYREKLLAGSWRFLTYFGRDTLLSVQMLMPVLGSDAIEAGLGSVLARVNAGGEVAHEEEIGELAVRRNLVATGQALADPSFDYAMVDDNLMLLPVLANYLADIPADQAWLFLARRTPAGIPYQEIIERNAAFVLRTARPFAAEPTTRHLIALKPGQVHGNWRDSEEGLAQGRYPYDVNAVLMPAALRAIARLADRGLLPVGTAEPTALAAIWQEKAGAFFDVQIAASDARLMAGRYAARAGVPAAEPVASDVRFSALALDADGAPIPVQHSDMGFALLFGEPDDAFLLTALDTALRPFPAGLMTPVGLLVANPVFAPDDVQAMVGQGNYHGTVVWSWQQAMWAAGIRRQLVRDDLSGPVKTRLAAAECKFWQVIDATRDVRASELWSWGYEGGTYHVVPFGQRAGDITESNAAQLWSTVYLGVTRPKSVPSTCSE